MALYCLVFIGRCPMLTNAAPLGLGRKRQSPKGAALVSTGQRPVEHFIKPILIFLKNQSPYKN